MLLCLGGCQTVGSLLGGYPSWTPEPNTPILTHHFHEDRRPKEPPYKGYNQIGLTAGEFTEFMRQRMWGCDWGCDGGYWEDSQIKHQFYEHPLYLDISAVPERWRDKTREVIHTMRDRLGVPFIIGAGNTSPRPIPILFEDTTGRDYSCVNLRQHKIIIATQHGADFTEDCLWEEIGHAAGMGRDTYNFDGVSRYVGSRPSAKRRGKSLNALDYASYWTLYDPRIPAFALGDEPEAISATIYHIAVHDLKLPTQRTSLDVALP